jgi:hypothetical protein
MTAGIEGPGGCGDMKTSYFSTLFCVLPVTFLLLINLRFKIRNKITHVRFSEPGAKNIFIGGVFV